MLSKNECRLFLTLSTLFGAVTAANAEVYTAPGGPVSDKGNAPASETAFTIPVTATGNVTKINSVTLTNFTFAFSGNLTLTLTDPSDNAETLCSPPIRDPESFNGTYTFIFDPNQQSIDDKYQADGGSNLSTSITIPSGTYAASRDGGGRNSGRHATDAAFVGAPAIGDWTVNFENFGSNNNGNIGSISLALTTTTSPTPEPASFGLVACSGLLLHRQRRHSRG